MTLGQACSQGIGSIAPPKYIIDPAPDARPKMMDGSPLFCPECQPVSGERMWKFTERDFVAVKKKIKEQKLYIEYLMSFIQ